MRGTQDHQDLGARRRPTRHTIVALAAAVALMAGLTIGVPTDALAATTRKPSGNLLGLVSPGRPR